MRRIYFCVAVIAGIWTVSVGDLTPIPVGNQHQAIQLAKATARELWMSVHVPTSVRVKDEAGHWRDESQYGDDVVA